jgi:hypothetical protein
MIVAGSKSNTSSIIIVPTAVFVVIVIGFCVYIKLRKPRQKHDGKYLKEYTFFITYIFITQ